MALHGSINVYGVSKHGNHCTFKLCLCYIIMLYIIDFTVGNVKSEIIKAITAYLKKKQLRPIFLPHFCDNVLLII